MMLAASQKCTDKMDEAVERIRSSKKDSSAENENTKADAFLNVFDEHSSLFVLFGDLFSPYSCVLEFLIYAWPYVLHLLYIAFQVLRYY